MDYQTVSLNKLVLSKELPATNGIYLFLSGTQPVYIGKSVNIKARVLSHIENAKKDPKEAAIIENSDTVGYYITDSEYKALLLESKLIQQHKPLYNVRWRDDKSYLYIKVPIHETYPKITLSRRENDHRSRYFGPFPTTKVTQGLLRSIRRIVPYCTHKRIGKRPCFYAKIGKCDPCPNLIEQAEKDEQLRLRRRYRSQIRKIIRILEGDTNDLQKSLQKQLKELTAQQRYEEAIEIRDRLRHLERFLQEHLVDEHGEEQYNQSQEALEQLTSLLQRYLPHLQGLERIECYDVSNTSQKDATASMVVMHSGLVDKQEYRKFKIKDLSSRSDFEMMKEVLIRRFRNEWQKPDLIVVDGGKPQVRIALQALAEAGFQGIPLIGIAKRPDRLVIGYADMITVRPPLSHRGFNLLRNLRDESHRFANTYHVFLRSKKMI
ncbi:MAG: GIY-YIG nuclease family protein [Patescibacteria group bacterium]